MFCKQVSCSYKTIPNAPKDNETDRIISLGSNGVDWVRSLRKIRKRLHGTNLCINYTSSTRFPTSFVNETLPNAPKHYETHKNMSLGSNGVNCVRSLQKIPMRLRCTNFYTSSARFAQTFVRQPNGPECTQIVLNASKHQFRVQRGGSGAFIVKNSDATSWHELLH